VQNAQYPNVSLRHYLIEQDVALPWSNDREVQRSNFWSDVAAPSRLWRIRSLSENPNSLLQCIVIRGSLSMAEPGRRPIENFRPITLGPCA
jgi:hypothetical protein